METEQDKPVDREAWRRLLAGGDDAPPGLTDARVRAAARRALAPRTGRWWLPASLAASLLLAVVIVQWQYEEKSVRGVMSESDVAAPAADEAAPRQNEPGPHYDLPATAPEGRELPREQFERERAPGIGYVDVAPPAVPPPQIELPAANDSRGASAVAPPSAPAGAAPEPAAKREEDLSELVVTGSRRRDSDLESSTPVTGVTQQDVAGDGAGVVGQLQKSREVLRAPEDWYAEIEKLRAAGRKEEADRELDKLERAYPGWVEKNHPPDP